MQNIKAIFHKISYIQYPLVVVSMVYYVLFIISMSNKAPDWQLLNNVLLFYGISLSFSTLQDTTKTQNKFSRKIWEHPKKGKRMLFIIVLLMVVLLVAGIIGMFGSTATIHREVSMGLIVLAIGLMGILKSASEMFENHRLDKNS